MIHTGEVMIKTRYGGSGLPLLLLHGHPQTHVMWHKIAGRLAQDFTVVVTDLRGYGDSSKPPTTPNHEPYSKRAQARDQIEVMRQLGFERFFVAGHDRSGHCAQRMAIDYPEQISKIAVLDIVPIAELFRHPDAREFGLEYWGWFFLAQPFELPERLIGADPDYYYWHRRWKDEIPDFFTHEAFAESVAALIILRIFTLFAKIMERTQRLISRLKKPTAKIIVASIVRCLHCGASAMNWKNGMTCWRFGANGRRTCAGERLIAVIISQKKHRMKFMRN